MATKGIYCASMVKHFEKWLALRAQGVPVTSTWIDEAGAGESEDRAALWTRCINESAEAAALILYREAGEPVKGAYCEMGAALACGVPVFFVGPTDGVSSAYKHPGVTLCSSLQEAVSRAEKAILDYRNRLDFLMAE